MSDSWHAASCPGLRMSVCNFMSVLIDTDCCASKLAVRVTGRYRIISASQYRRLSESPYNEMLGLLRAYQESFGAVMSSCMQSRVLATLCSLVLWVTIAGASCRMPILHTFTQCY